MLFLKALIFDPHISGSEPRFRAWVHSERLWNAGVIETLPKEIQDQVKGMVADAVTVATAQMRSSLEEAKRTIAALLARIYGTKAETKDVILTEEGQQYMDFILAQLREKAAPAPAPAKESIPRKPRNRSGLAQRYPSLDIKETQADIPAEFKDQIAAGTLIAARSGTYHDEIVTPTESPYLRRVFDIEIRRPDGRPLVQISADRIVPGGDLADETIHRFVMSKSLDAMPFHRQVKSLDRVGVEISKQTINDNVNAWGALFAPMAAAIRGQILRSGVVHADASWQRLQAAKACERIHLWTVLDKAQVSFLITEDERHGRANEIIPDNFAGKLMTDAWPGWFKLLLGDRHGLCNYHARRPFASWLKRIPNDTDCLRVIAIFSRLAACEREANEGPADQLLQRRRKLREERARPAMKDLHDEVTRIAKSIPKSHPIGDGAHYILDHWEGLTRFLDQPDMPFDNNAAENALRINALIRNNSMFSGSLAGAHRDATALTILHSCRLQKLNPYQYLAEVTPVLLLHRRGRPQNLDAYTPAAVMARRGAR